MDYFTEQAYSHEEVREKIRIKYGTKARIMTHRTVRIGGFLGFFTREGVEVTGYISKEPERKMNLKMEDEKRKILHNLTKDKTIDVVLKEVKEIKEHIAKEKILKNETIHSSIKEIEELLMANDFTFEFINSISNRLKNKMTLDELDNLKFVKKRVKEWITDEIMIYEDKIDKIPKIFVIVGPTGVGKTTTIAKLAAIFGISRKNGKNNSVRILTIDNYRIGAKKQIETYGEIMGIPVSCVETFRDLRKKLDLYNDIDLILIDTIGKSPKDYMKLAEMRELLDACGSTAEIHLAISASTKASDVDEILHQFEPFRYRSIILTKLDETMKVGNIISILSKKKKELSYLTVGQVVPQDIEKASVEKILMYLDGFK